MLASLKYGLKEISIIGLQRGLLTSSPQSVKSSLILRRLAITLRISTVHVGTDMHVDK